MTSSPCMTSESHVCNLGTKLHTFSVGVGLDVAPCSILFVAFMDRISRCHQGKDCVQLGNLRTVPLLFADDVFLPSVKQDES